MLGKTYNAWIGHNVLYLVCLLLTSNTKSENSIEFSLYNIHDKPYFLLNIKLKTIIFIFLIIFLSFKYFQFLLMNDFHIKY